MIDPRISRIRKNTTEVRYKALASTDVEATELMTIADKNGLRCSRIEAMKVGWVRLKFIPKL